MTNSEAYDAGYAAGESAANYAEAYENASQDDYNAESVEVPARFMPSAEEAERSHGQARTDYERGHEDGWNAHFDEQVTIQVRARLIGTDEAHANVSAGSEINPATAVTIASWWQSPGRVGSDLAAFASGAETLVVDLLADIEATRPEVTEPRDTEALAALAAFVMNNAGSFINAS